LGDLALRHRLFHCIRSAATCLSDRILRRSEHIAQHKRTRDEQRNRKQGAAKPDAARKLRRLWSWVWINSCLVFVLLFLVKLVGPPRVSGTIARAPVVPVVMLRHVERPMLLSHFSY